MGLEVIIQSILGLVVILAILLFLLFYKPSKKTNIVVKAKPIVKAKAKKVDLESLKNDLKNKKNSAKDLQNILDLITKDYINIPPKKGHKQAPEFNIYMDIIFTICRHQNTTKEIILNFDKHLEKANPAYKTDISKALTKGLNLRL